MGRRRAARHAGRESRRARPARRPIELLGKVGAKITGVIVWGLDESRAGSSAYGYSSGYYYASYYSMGGQPGKRGKYDNGAQAVGVGPDSAAREWVPEESAGRRFARFVGSVLTGVLTFLLILAVAAAVAYFLDQYFGWGLVSTFSGYWGG